MTLFYRLGDKLYVNITNRCSCDCVFCIRRNCDSVGDADSLWLEREPTINEVKSAFDSFSEQELNDVNEIVFCGYGEPMERADDVISVTEYIKSKTPLPVRLNTNGLVKLINPGFDISRVSVFDSISVSLNADNAVDYQKLTRTVFGEGSFESMFEFAKQVKEYTNVFFTVVDVEDVNVKKCKAVSEEAGIILRVRHYEKK
ncbi:MAG: TatD family nuclease-associated radical SAM protein [Oscillospiraceae bacterium]|nr:TatD family nuclease-associated radical SAM protein [Oscillospiraceae bacterium]